MRYLGFLRVLGATGLLELIQIESGRHKETNLAEKETNKEKKKQTKKETKKSSENNTQLPLPTGGGVKKENRNNLAAIWYIVTKFRMSNSKIIAKLLVKWLIKQQILLLKTVTILSRVV